MSSLRRSQRNALRQRRSSRFSFRAGEQPTSLQINSSSARLLHSGIRYVGLTSFFTGFDCSIMLNGRLSPAWPLISHIFISGDERETPTLFFLLRRPPGGRIEKSQIGQTLHE